MGGRQGGGEGGREVTKNPPKFREFPAFFGARAGVTRASLDARASQMGGKYITKVIPKFLTHTRGKSLKIVLKKIKSSNLTK